MRRRVPACFTLLLILLAGCHAPASTGWSGYAEGEDIYIAAPVAGRLARLSVQAGQTVADGAPLFALEATTELAARAEADARVLAAQAQAANTTKGRRADEVSVTQAQLAQARAQAERADADLKRQQALVAQEFISRSRLDDAATALAQAKARVSELEAAVRVAGLPARADERASAEAQAEAARQAQRQLQWREQETQQAAPTAGVVRDTFWRVGEYVPAGQPVLALLPPAARKARFFVPEAEVGGLAPGQAVTLHCDGCGAPIAARITRIATQAEYTPPVIYSNTQRARMVFMVEARPAPDDAPRLHPGQPLDVRRAP
ncbi:MAG: HlyD family efflux transporter periplasmic adaptor subunit [Vitreoscilla sp.]|jgi:HlyD family secretion protein|nr:HlyD family efflux transporter periplasmic adaptor subunit [Vitreoscilla sp.]